MLLPYEMQHSLDSSLLVQLTLAPVSPSRARCKPAITANADGMQVGSHAIYAQLLVTQYDPTPVTLLARHPPSTQMCRSLFR